MQSEEAKFYFVEQALEEAKHYDALRRLSRKSPAAAGEPSRSVRMLYSFGVVDPDDVAFMMGNINIIGEHLANQIFHQINHVAKDETVRKVLALIGKDESRHIAAGQRFFGEVYPHFRKTVTASWRRTSRRRSCSRFAGYELVNPMRKLDIDLAKIIEAMYQHYDDVTDGLPAFPEQGIFDVLLSSLRKNTPRAISVVHKVTGDGGQSTRAPRCAVRSARSNRRARSASSSRPEPKVDGAAVSIARAREDDADNRAAHA